MNILIAADQCELMPGVSECLKSSGYVVKRADNFAKAQLLLKSNVFDLLILDHDLPDEDGIDCLKKLRKYRNNFPIIFLTKNDSLDTRIAAFDWGVDSYLVKPFAIPELKARCRAHIRRLHAGEKMQEPRVIQIGSITLDSWEKVVRSGGQLINLTCQEWIYLECLARNAGKLVSKKQFISLSKKPKEKLTINAIEATISRLRRKLDGSGVGIQLITRQGYLLNEI